MKSLIAGLKLLWNPPRERFLVRSMVLTCVVVIATAGVATYWMFAPQGPAKPAHGEHAAAEGHGEEHGAEAGDEHGGGEEAHGEVAEHEGGGEGHGEGGEEHAEAGEHGGEHGAESQSIYAAKIPKEITERQDGVPEPDMDLVDPKIEAARGLAATLKQDLKVKKEFRFVEIPEVMASTRIGANFSGKVLASIFVEVDSLETEKEVKARGVEFKGLIASIIAEKQRDALKTPEGQAQLKTEILRELNHLIKDGRVNDVLMSSFFAL